jgi:hypothetical protein
LRKFLIKKGRAGDGAMQLAASNYDGIGIARISNLSFRVNISRIETIDEMKISFDRRIAIDHCIGDKGSARATRLQSSLALICTRQLGQTLMRA